MHIKELEEKLGYDFENLDLLELALIHKSSNFDFILNIVDLIID